MKCHLCDTEIVQGKTGYEIGMMKWFNKIQPFPVLILLCDEHAGDVAELLKLSDFDRKKVKEQKED